MLQLSEIAHSFRAMNSDINGTICETPENRIAAARALGRVELLFQLIERTLTPFQPDSELSNLNQSAGRPFSASGMLCEVVSAALDAAQATGGLFNPAITPLTQSGDWHKVIVDPANRNIYLPPGCNLDLGGIGKGWAVDQAYYILKHFPDFALDAGGEIRVQGNQVDGSHWSIGIADPLIEGREVGCLKLNGGAICTSTATKGKTGPNGIISATVIAETAVQAGIFAQATLLAGPNRGIQLIEKQPGCKGLIILNDGAVLTAGLAQLQSVV